MAEAAEHEEEKAPDQPEGQDLEESKDEGEGVDLARKPGGDTGADVYARRRAAELKQTREERDRLRENNIRMEERLRALEETKKEPEKPKVREYSPEEVQDLIDKGEIKPAIGAAYLARIEARRAVADVEKRQQEQAPLVQSRAEIVEYVKHIPALGDQGSEEYAKANREFIELVNRGFASDDRTRAIAIRMAFGDPDSLKKKAELRNMNRNAPNTPSDSGGNGGNGGGGKPKDISQAPADFQQYWKGAGLTKQEQERHFKGWQARQAKK